MYRELFDITGSNRIFLVSLSEIFNHDIDEYDFIIQ